MLTECISHIFDNKIEITKDREGQDLLRTDVLIIHLSWYYRLIVEMLITLTIAFKQSVLLYKCLHGSTPAYLTDELCQVADVKASQRLRSSSSSSLIVSRTRLPTVSDRAFPVAAARVWNSLPDLVTSAPSVAVFRSRLKTHLFNKHFLPL